MTRITLVLAALAMTAATAAGIDASTAALDEILEEVKAAYDDGQFERGDELLAVADQRFAGEETLVQFEIDLAMYKEKYDEALSLVNEWISSHDDVHDYRALKAHLLDKMDRDAEAVAELQALTSSAGEPEDYVQLGNLLFTQNSADYNQIVTAFEAAVVAYTDAKRPIPPDVFYNLACAYGRLNNAERALANVKVAAVADPKYFVMAAADEDLESLRGNAEFEKAVADAEAKMAAPKPEEMTVKPGEAAPLFALKGVDGKEYNLADYRGRYVVLNIFATWCPPCRAEIPDLVDFAAAHAADGVSVLAISVDEATADLGGFASEMKMNYPVLWDDGGTANKYLAVTGGIPQTYFIDGTGIVRNHIYGGAPRGVFESKLAALRANP